MKVTPAIVKDEFIGLTAKVAESTNPNYLGISGIVVDETRNTFRIQEGKKLKTIVKNQASFHFTLPDATVIEIDGKILVGKPEERLKKRIRRFW